MIKFRDLWKKSDGSTGASLLRYGIILSVAALLFLFVKRDNIINWAQANAEIRSQEKEMERLRQYNSRLEDSIRTLENNLDSLEKFAREQYRFSEKGDEVFLTR